MPSNVVDPVQEIADALDALKRSEPYLRPDANAWMNTLDVATLFTSKFVKIAPWLSSNMQRYGQAFEMTYIGYDALDVLTLGMEALAQSPIGPMTVLNMVQMIMTFSLYQNLWQWLDDIQQEKFLNNMDALKLWFVEHTS